MRHPLLAAALLSLAACATTGLSGNGQRVRVSYAGGAPLQCQNLGPVSGEGKGAGDDPAVLTDRAMVDARNRAGDLGASDLVISAPELGESRGTTDHAAVNGIAYKCQ